MNDAENRQWRVARHPSPIETIGPDHFEWTAEPVPTIEDGEFLVRTVCLAPIPAQRGYLQADHAHFFDTVPIGDVMRGRGVGQIVESRHPDYAKGEIFVGSLGWQDYSVQRPRGAEFVFSTKKIEQPFRPLSAHLGALGQAGATAYFGLLDASELKSGDNVLVSAAAGGVGSCATQIARIKGGATVVGIAGSKAKCDWIVDTLGATAAIDYKNEDVGVRIAELFPDGIDVFFDNVGGEILDAALANLAMRARVAICGYISTDYATGPVTGPANYRCLLQRRARMQGFVSFDFWERYPEAERDLLAWHRAGALDLAEDVDDGLEEMPNSLAALFTGANRGIRICRVAPDPADLPG